LAFYFHISYELGIVASKMRLGFPVGLGNFLFALPVESSKPFVKYLLTATYGVKTDGPWSLFLTSIQSRVKDLWSFGHEDFISFFMHTDSG